MKLGSHQLETQPHMSRQGVTSTKQYVMQNFVLSCYSFWNQANTEPWLITANFGLPKAIDRLAVISHAGEVAEDEKAACTCYVWCRSLSHHHFCLPPSKHFYLLIPLIKTLVLAIRTLCTEEILLSSKLNKLRVFSL